MARKRSGRRRGRPRHTHARRRQTTRAGRKGTPEPVDRGSERLRAKKRGATGRDDLELNPVSVLFGRGLLDHQQYDELGRLTFWLARLARNLGPKSGAVAALWSALTGAAIGTVGVIVPTGIGESADRARYVLGSLLRRLDGSKDLIVALAEGRVSPLVHHAVDEALTPVDRVELARLRDGLDSLAGRRKHQLPGGS